MENNYVHLDVDPIHNNYLHLDMDGGQYEFDSESDISLAPDKESNRVEANNHSDASPSATDNGDGENDPDSNSDVSPGTDLDALSHFSQERDFEIELGLSHGTRVHFMAHKSRLFPKCTWIREGDFGSKYEHNDATWDSVKAMIALHAILQCEDSLGPKFVTNRLSKITSLKEWYWLVFYAKEFGCLARLQMQPFCKLVSKIKSGGRRISEDPNWYLILPIARGLSPLYYLTSDDSGDSEDSEDSEDLEDLEDLVDVDDLMDLLYLGKDEHMNWCVVQDGVCKDAHGRVIPYEDAWYDHDKTLMGKSYLYNSPPQPPSTKKTDTMSRTTESDNNAGIIKRTVFHLAIQVSLDRLEWLRENPTKHPSDLRIGHWAKGGALQCRHCPKGSWKYIEGPLQLLWTQFIAPRGSLLYPNGPQSLGAMVGRLESLYETLFEFRPGYFRRADECDSLLDLIEIGHALMGTVGTEEDLIEQSVARNPHDYTKCKIGLPRGVVVDGERIVERPYGYYREIPLRGDPLANVCLNPAGCLKGKGCR
ncbi:hypothetical protein IMZ48_41680 [Candidatus Bathyarchaeota archaeon]|nr:hypothetical protein [Candidatus Bathyarchaeota archaeon]